MLTSARPVSRERFNLGEAYPIRNLSTCHLRQYTGRLDRRLNTQTFPHVWRDRSGRHIRQKKCLWNRNIRVLAGNTDSQVLCKLLEPTSVPPRGLTSADLAKIRLTKLIACDYTAAAHERPKRRRDQSSGCRV